ncbi:MAG TPA: hypothetical protein VMW52_09465 [Phycisphaerae bacterium]|nr:hypothetical protein [Phycisphaerae bacterium]
MVAPNKCRTKWSDAAGSNWHACCLAENHTGPHMSPNGTVPVKDASRVYAYDIFRHNADGYLTPLSNAKAYPK